MATNWTGMKHMLFVASAYANVILNCMSSNIWSIVKTLVQHLVIEAMREKLEILPFPLVHV